MSPSQAGGPIFGEKVLSKPIELEWFKYAKHAAIGRTFMENMTVRFDEPSGDMWIRDQVARFVVESSMVGQKLKPDVFAESTAVEFSSPATWWQHWKTAHADTWWAGWVARWRPPVMSVERRVATATVNVARAALFPEADIVAYGPPLGPPRLHWWRDQTEWNVTSG